MLEVLRVSGLALPVTLDGDVPGWELVHDSLVDRVLDWADRKDLARRKAKELVRSAASALEPLGPAAAPLVDLALSLLGKVEAAVERERDENTLRAH